MGRIGSPGTPRQLAPAGANGWYVARLQHAARAQKGFAGPGHMATQVVGSDALDFTDPFVLLMDDVLTFAPDQLIGRAHPHAGIATATLVLQGALIDKDEGALEAGDIVWMIAGRGIVHNESVHVRGFARVLQLWLGLPEVLRSQPPSLQRLVPASGSAQGFQLYKAPISAGGHDFGELQIATVSLSPGDAIDVTFPLEDTLLIYILDGSLELQRHLLKTGDVAWLKHASSLPGELLHLVAGGAGLHAVLFGAPPVGEPLLHHGPFVAGSPNELASYYASFTKGDFQSIGEIYTLPPDTPVHRT